LLWRVRYRVGGENWEDQGEATRDVDGHRLGISDCLYGELEIGGSIQDWGGLFILSGMFACGLFDIS
jgi:hypothetical protein